MIVNDRYKVLKPLKRGGYGQVYKARDAKSNGETVALKLVSIEKQDKNCVDALKREYKLLTKLDSPSIVTAYELGKGPKHHYLAMEYIDGRDLSVILRHDLAFLAKNIYRIVYNLALGLMELECKGVVHGDLKPANVMIDSEGNVKLIDFALGHKKWGGIFL
jgi:eukaryotic-like serine/threonine-protein kinase